MKKAILKSPHFFFTVDVEEWFASKLFKTTPEEKEALYDLAETLEFILDLLSRKKIKGTFFCLYHTAKKYPEVIQRAIKEGHEIALHGDEHDNILDLGPEKFRAMLTKAREGFKKDFGVDLKGYRAPHFGMNDQLRPLLKQSGFSYDSSVVPCLPIPGWYGSFSEPRTPYYDATNEIWEFPISVHPFIRLPGGGGYYFRNLGRLWTSHVLKSSLKSLKYGMLYIHPWELSNNNPTNRPNVPFYTFRRTGDWARKNLEIMLDELLKLPNVTSVPIKEIYSKL